MSKFAFGFCTGLAAGLVLIALLRQEQVLDIELPPGIDPTSVPKPGFPQQSEGPRDR